MRALIALIFLLFYMNSLKASYDVIIIGGGMAGLSALNHLNTNGVKNVALFEAKDRLGGRVHSLKTKYGSIDLGAQWIHGASILNSVFNLANSKQFLNELKCESKEMFFISSSGTILTEEQRKKILKPLKALFDMPDGIQIEEYLNEKFDELLENYPRHLHKLMREVFNALKVNFCFYRGNDLNVLYNTNIFTPLKCDIDLPGPMDQMIQALVKGDLGNKAHLRSEVIGLTLIEDGGAIAVDVLQEERRTNYVAKYVIYTPSVGVLKHLDLSYFNPPLPRKKLDALSRLGLGRGVKIFLQYEEPFWKQGNFTALLLGTSDKNYHAKDWESLAALFLELRDVTNTLMTVVIGAASLEVERMDPKAIGLKLTKKLRRYTGDYSIPLPSEVIRTKWNHDKFIRGTWTSIYEGFTPADIVALAAPHMNGRLRFAGESTAGQFFTTIHGARTSGLREAEEILELLTMSPRPVIKTENVPLNEQLYFYDALWKIEETSTL